jgi:hypothetical protein
MNMVRAVHRPARNEGGTALRARRAGVGFLMVMLSDRERTTHTETDRCRYSDQVSAFCDHIGDKSDRRDHLHAYLNVSVDSD